MPGGRTDVRLQDNRTRRNDDAVHSISFSGFGLRSESGDARTRDAQCVIRKLAALCAYLDLDECAIFPFSLVCPSH